jgi:branched-chain amino acid transport system ATP-binding protein
MGQVATSGSIRFKGEDVQGMQPFQIVRKGIGYVPESRDVFPTLSVEQNLLLGRQGKRSARWQLSDIFRLFPQLERRRDTPAGVLSGGEQQMLSLCRSLMGEPSLLLVDEPTEGLAPRMIEQLAGFLQELAAEGVSILLAEQKLAIALKISQRVYLMGRGMIVFDGTPAELQENPALRREWLEV